MLSLADFLKLHVEVSLGPVSLSDLQDLRDPGLLNLAYFLTLHVEVSLGPVSLSNLQILLDPGLLSLANFLTLHVEVSLCPVSLSDLQGMREQDLLSLADVSTLQGEALLDPLLLFDPLDTHLYELQDRDDFLDILLAMLSIPDLPESGLFNLADILCPLAEILIDLDLHTRSNLLDTSIGDRLLFGDISGEASFRIKLAAPLLIDMLLHG